MPIVAAGGCHILNIDFYLLQICQGSDGTKGGAHKDKHPSDDEREEELRKEKKEKKLFLNKEKLCLLLKLWRIRRPNWRRKVQFPPLARRVARRVRIVRNRKATVH